MTPGEHLRAEIARLGMDQIAVAKATGVSRQTINNIINGRQPISRTMAARLGRLTGRGSDYWLQSRFPDAGRGTKRAASLTVRGQGPTAPLVDHQILRAIRDGVIHIEPFRQDKVTRVSLELTLHPVLLTGSGERVEIGHSEGFLLRAGQLINACTYELIELPIDFVGRLGAIADLARFGLITAHGAHLEPGFRGRPQVVLFNAGSRGFTLRRGISLLTLELVPLAARPAQAEVIAKRAEPNDDRADVARYFRAEQGVR